MPFSPSFILNKDHGGSRALLFFFKISLRKKNVNKKDDSYNNYNNNNLLTLFMLFFIRSPCEVAVAVPGDDLVFALTTPLQLGGVKSKSTMLPGDLGKHGLDGCIKDVFHNGQVSDQLIIHFSL